MPSEICPNKSDLFFTTFCLSVCFLSFQMVVNFRHIVGRQILSQSADLGVLKLLWPQVVYIQLFYEKCYCVQQ